MNALMVSRVSRETIEGYQDSRVVFQEFLKLLDNDIDKFKKNEKITVYGYNVKFDMDMLAGWAKRQGFKYFYSYFNRHVIDVMGIASTAKALAVEAIESLALSSVCEYLNIELDAHDAMNDIVATRQVLFDLLELIKKV